MAAIGDNPAEMHAIGVQLAHAYIDEVRADYLGPIGDEPGVLSAKQVYDFHNRVFVRNHISMAYFGGTIFTGNQWELKLTAPIWCPNCDPSSSPGGG